MDWARWLVRLLEWLDLLSLIHYLTTLLRTVSVGSVVRGDLDLVPLFTLGRDTLELVEDDLLLNTALSLDKW
jgi:hypothetical protein